MEDLDVMYLAAAITAVTVDTQTLLVAADAELPQTDTFKIPFGTELRIFAGEDVLLEPAIEACDVVDITVTLREDGTATLWVNATEYADLRIPIRVDASWRTAN
jgi:hypothetical protein